MNKTDTLPPLPIIIILDKPRAIRFTMRGIYDIEQIYGNMRSMLDAYFSATPETALNATIDVLSVLLRLDKGYIYKHITEKALMDIRAKIPACITACFADAREGTSEGAYKDPYEPYDWDELYYIARYKLKMTDKEFWDTTPRRFDKLYYLWLADNGIIKKEPKIYTGEINY